MPLCVTGTHAVWRSRKNLSRASEAQSMCPGSDTDISCMTSDKLLNHIVSVSWCVKGERNNTYLSHITHRVVFIKKRKHGSNLYIDSERKALRFEKLVPSKPTPLSIYELELILFHLNSSNSSFSILYHLSQFGLL